MISGHNSASFIGADLLDADGDKIGTIDQILVDPATGQPTWATVKSGLFGTSRAFVPLDGADESGGDLRVPYPTDVVKRSPHHKSDGGLSSDDEARLHAYYRDPEAYEPDGQ